MLLGQELKEPGQVPLEQNRPAVLAPEQMLLEQTPLVQMRPVLRVPSTLEVQQERLTPALEPVPPGLMEHYLEPSRQGHWTPGQQMFLISAPALMEQNRPERLKAGSIAAQESFQFLGQDPPGLKTLQRWTG